jgi:hypothetical protein
MSKTDLKLDWATHEAAKYAVMHWHYSKRMPMPPLLKIGIWEDGVFVGVVLFGRGSTSTLGRKFGCSQLETTELVRIAMRDHATTVSRVVSIAIAFLKRKNPGLKIVISFADPSQGHIGSIYQAGNWIYTGMSPPDKQYFYQERWQHSREIRGGAFGGKRKLKDYSHLPFKIASGKYRYVMPLDKKMRKQIEPLRKPYPKKPQADGSNLTTS